MLLPEALYGLAGEVVTAIAPHSESDPVALLVQFLTMFGVVIGRQSYGQVEATRHYGNLFTVIAGRTARSRKGTSYGHIEALMHRADTTWTRGNHIKGAGSGEGLVYAVRDKRTSIEPVKEKGRIIDYEEVELDPGVADKRALYMTGEFSSVLKVASREGNTLSETLRDIWDTGYLRCATRHNPLTATDAHIGIVGHITIDEIQKLLTSIDMANGFANRFLWICAKRSKELPDGGDISSVNFQPMLDILQKAIAFSHQSHHLKRTAEARRAWHVVYGMLSENRTGLADTLLARAEAIVFRLSILYALLDCSLEIHLDHLNAALALWQYAEDSAAYIFGDTVGDETADPILSALSMAGDSGLTREQLTVDVFQRHIKAPELTRALTLLATQRRIIQTQRIPTGGIGRPVTLYHLAARQSCEVSEVSTSRYLIASNDAAKQPDLVCEVSAKKVRSKSPEVNGAVHGDPVPAFTAFTASSLWCPTCRSDHAVTLVGREYHCVVCGAVAGYRPGEDGEMQQTAGAPPADVRVASEPAPELQLIKADSTTETSATSSNPLIDGDPNTDAPATRPILPGDGLAGVYAPRDYRTWVTGKIPITQGVLREPLPPPTQHDTPSACATYRGTLCQVKACDGHRERFRPSGLCTRCWGRAKKVTHAAEVR